MIEIKFCRLLYRIHHNSAPKQIITLFKKKQIDRQIILQSLL